MIIILGRDKRRNGGNKDIAINDFVVGYVTHKLNTRIFILTVKKRENASVADTCRAFFFSIFLSPRRCTAK